MARAPSRTKVTIATTKVVTLRVQIWTSVKL
ncbi:MAG: sec-independent protein translocase protein TatC [bacterium P201]|nr:MAG: sec-independent protein translocase protein TatC [bacterium P201]